MQVVQELLVGLLLMITQVVQTHQQVSIDLIQEEKTMLLIQIVST